MKFMTPAILTGTVAAAAMLVAVEARPDTRDDIMDQVVRPCVADEVEELDLSSGHAPPAATIMYELNRDYYEEIVDAVEEAFEKHPGVAAKTILEAGLAACLQNLDTWQGEDE